jgi:hypothetical protein
LWVCALADSESSFPAWVRRIAGVSAFVGE